MEERAAALQYLENLCPRRVDRKDLEVLFAEFVREEYVKDDVLWTQGSPSTCMKLLVQGRLRAVLENEAGTSETIASGNTIGEQGLLENVARMCSVFCLSEEAVLYSLSNEAYERLVVENPHAARVIDLICVRYLSARVQVSYCVHW
jgi:CRP-like cAMP-binding protein